MIRIDSTAERLKLEIEEKWGAAIWKTEFTFKTIEDITKKTGHPLSFAEYMKMLVEGIDGTNESVHLDVISQQQLEMLRSQSSNVKSSRNKRYFIITYYHPNERVQYPLPLSPLENPDQKTLKRIV